MNKRCLIIVDMQLGFINKHTSHLTEKITAFIESHHFDSVIATRYCNNPQTACYQLGGWKECIAGSQDVLLIPRLAQYIHRTFDKTTFSGFTSELQTFLKQENFKTVYFCGVNTDCCVLATVLSCYDNRQDCIVIADLCASTLGKQAHDNAIALMQDNITPQRVVLSCNITEQSD